MFNFFILETPHSDAYEADSIDAMSYNTFIFYNFKRCTCSGRKWPILGISIITPTPALPDS